jgi:hypothetical protein
MSQTLRQMRALPRRLTPAGRFWTAYAIGALLGVYVLVDIVTRVAG